MPGAGCCEGISPHYAGALSRDRSGALTATGHPVAAPAQLRMRSHSVIGWAAALGDLRNAAFASRDHYVLPRPAPAGDDR
jgi:hypothetical protein